jgi:hypothetical protein
MDDHGVGFDNYIDVNVDVDDVVVDDNVVVWC